MCIRKILFIGVIIQSALNDAVFKISVDHARLRSQKVNKQICGIPAFSAPWQRYPGYHWFRRYRPLP